MDLRIPLLKGAHSFTVASKAFSATEAGYLGGLAYCGRAHAGTVAAVDTVTQIIIY